MPNVGLQLVTPRSRVACFTHWASQAHLKCYFFFSFLLELVRSNRSTGNFPGLLPNSLGPKALWLPMSSGNQ